MSLPGEFARRVEDSSLVLWRPGLTVWLAAWNNDHQQDQATRLASIKDAASPLRFAEQESVADGVTRYGYRLRDRSPEGEIESVNAYAIAADGHLQMSIYSDDVSDEAVAWQLAGSAAHRRQA